MHISRGAFVLLFFLVNMWLVPSALGRVLFRPSNSASDPFTTDEGTGILLKQHPKPLHLRNVTGLHSPEENVFPILASDRIFRRAPKQPAAATDDELASSTAKGCSMLYMLAANAYDALARMKTNPKLQALQSSQSKWTNAGALKQYGWTEKKDQVNWAYMGVNDVMEELSVDTASKDNQNVQLLQDTVVEVDGTKFVASKGVYDQAINVAAGLVIPYYVYSPRHEAQDKNIQGELVPLAQYSDVLFLEYSKLCGRAKTSVSGLKHFLFLNVENKGTWAIALKALMNENGGKEDIPLWPGTEFSLNSKEGKALLGTQIGAPLAWMLIQHKEAFGARSVVKVRVFRNKGMTNKDTDQPYPSLLFYVDDAPEDNHCEPFDVCCCPKV